MNSTPKTEYKNQQLFRHAYSTATILQSFELPSPFVVPMKAHLARNCHGKYGAALTEPRNRGGRSSRLIVGFRTTVKNGTLYLGISKHFYMLRLVHVYSSLERSRIVPAKPLSV